MFFKVILLLFIVSCSSTPRVYTTEESAKLLDNQTNIKIIIDNLAMDQIATHYCTGMVIGIVTPDGEDYYSYGLKNIEHNESMPTDAIFQVGSVTKIFTSALLVKLEQEKVLSVKDPIKKFFPENFHPYTKGLENLTLESLSSHSSGLPSEHQSFTMIGNALKFLWTGENMWKNFDEQMMWDFFKEFDFGKLNKHPYCYSNIGYILLGNLLGNAQPNTDYETLLEQKILSPMHLTDTKFELTTKQKDKLATGYSGGIPTFMRSGQMMKPWEIKKGLRSSGSLYSNAQDLISFLKVNMGIGHDAININFDAAHEKRIPTPKGHVGLGWFIETLPKSKREYVFADGIISGYTSFMGFDNNSKVGIVILQNTMNMRNDIGEKLLDRIVYNYNNKIDFKLNGQGSIRK
jgi:CubicO group peptidase (beta-lactamase class C family)